MEIFQCCQGQKCSRQSMTILLPYFYFCVIKCYQWSVFCVWTSLCSKKFIPWCFALTFGKNLSRWCGLPLFHHGSICLCRGWPRGSVDPVRKWSPCWRLKLAHVDSGSVVPPESAEQTDICVRGAMNCQLSSLKVYIDTVGTTWSLPGLHRTGQAA